MAVRLLNTHTHPLNVDLRGGETLVLPPQSTSRALLEELLYDNPNLREWEANGWLVRLPARFEETQASEIAAKAEKKRRADDPKPPTRRTPR
jgi:hypothetical protein